MSTVGANDTTINATTQIWRVQTEHIFDAQLVVESLVVSFYVAVLYFLLSSLNQFFRSAFYTLFIINGSDWEIVIRIAAALTGTNFVVHICLNMMITINRLTAVLIPLDHKRLWKADKYLPVATCLIIFSFLAYTTVFTRPRKIIISGDFCSCQGDYDEFTLYFSLIAVAIFEADCLFISPLTIYQFSIVKRNNGIATGDKTEASLAFFAAIKGAAFSFEFLFELARFVNMEVIMGTWLFTFVRDQFYAYFFLLTVLNAPTLIFLSAPLRHEIFRKFGLVKSSSVVPIQSIVRNHQVVRSFVFVVVSVSRISCHSSD